MNGTNVDIQEKAVRQFFKNKRCSSVFKDVLPDGTWTAHDIDSVVCSDNGGITWFSGGTTKQWMEDITFPYLPPVEPKKSIYRIYRRSSSWIHGG